jgi:hypothetical protein
MLGTDIAQFPQNRIKLVQQPCARGYKRFPDRREADVPRRTIKQLHAEFGLNLPNS